MTVAWKQHEKRTAKALGGHRIGVTGRSTVDVIAPWLSVECKQRRRLPAWIESALRQAEAGAGSERLPIAVLHEKNRRSGNDLVVMRQRDFLIWFGGPVTEERQFTDSRQASGKE